MRENYDEIRRFILATNKIDGAYYFCAKRLGIKENMLAVLYAIDDGKPHSQKQIGKEWLIPKTTISTIIKELVLSGYIRLLSEEHTKEKTICLTESGRSYVDTVLRDVYEAEQRAMERTFEKFSPEFVEAMEYFADVLCKEFEERKLGT